MEIKGKFVMAYDWRKITRNPRNPRRDFDTTDIDASVREHGVKDAVTVNQDGMLYKGERRLTAISKTNHDMLPAIVIDDRNLTETEKYEIILDHSESKPLSKSEAYNAVQELIRLSFGQTAVIKRCASILNQAFGSPSKEKIASARAEAVNCHEDPDRAEEEVIKTKHRGTIQNMERLASMPDFVAEEYVKAWQGRQSLISQKDILILSRLWEELWKADPTVKRDTPPQEFVDKFTELKAVNAEPEVPGEAKKAKKSKAETENMMKACENAFVRKTLSWTLGDITEQAFLSDIKSLEKQFGMTK